MKIRGFFEYIKALLFTIYYKPINNAKHQVNITILNGYFLPLSLNPPPRKGGVGFMIYVRLLQKSQSIFS